MSDLASSCEYYTSEKTCLAVSENLKAQTNRQLRCLNDDKQCCCYICDSRQECAISCKYLSAVDSNLSSQAQTPQIQAQTPLENIQAEFKQPEITIPTFCSSCNIEMTPKKCKLTLDEPTSKEETLPVIIHLCPSCGRIEFKSAN